MSVVDQKDCAEEFVFDRTGNERPAWELSFFSKTLKVDRSLLLCALFYLVLIPIVISSVIVLLISDCNAKTTSAIAILSACLGYLAPKGH